MVMMREDRGKGWFQEHRQCSGWAGRSAHETVATEMRKEFRLQQCCGDGVNTISLRNSRRCR